MQYFNKAQQTQFSAVTFLVTKVPYRNWIPTSYVMLVFSATLIRPKNNVTQTFLHTNLFEPKTSLGDVTAHTHRCWITWCTGFSNSYTKVTQNKHSVPEYTSYTIEGFKHSQKIRISLSNVTTMAIVRDRNHELHYSASKQVNKQNNVNGSTISGQLLYAC